MESIKKSALLSGATYDLLQTAPVRQPRPVHEALPDALQSLGAKRPEPPPPAPLAGVVVEVAAGAARGLGVPVRQVRQDAVLQHQRRQPPEPRPQEPPGREAPQPLERRRIGAGQF